MAKGRCCFSGAYKKKKERNEKSSAGSFVFIFPGRARHSDWTHSIIKFWKLQFTFQALFVSLYLSYLINVAWHQEWHQEFFFFLYNILHIQPLMLKCGSKMIFHTEEEEEEEAVLPWCLPCVTYQWGNQWGEFSCRLCVQSGCNANAKLDALSHSETETHSRLPPTLAGQIYSEPVQRPSA